MKFFAWRKDGGPESTVSGLFFIEIKNLFSVALLKFEDGSRDAFHGHAFNSVSWVLRGKLYEHMGPNPAYMACYFNPRSEEGEWQIYRPSFRPVKTRRDTFHKVVSKGTTWVLTFRGPWSDTWVEYDPKTFKYTTLTHGREEV